MAIPNASLLKMIEPAITSTISDLKAKIAEGPKGFFKPKPEELQLEKLQLNQQCARLITLSKDLADLKAQNLPEVELGSKIREVMLIAYIDVAAQEALNPKAKKKGPLTEKLEDIMGPPEAGNIFMKNYMKYPEYAYNENRVKGHTNYEAGCLFLTNEDPERERMMEHLFDKILDTLTVSNPANEKLFVSYMHTLANTTIEGYGEFNKAVDARFRVVSNASPQVQKELQNMLQVNRQDMKGGEEKEAKQIYAGLSQTPAFKAILGQLIEAKVKPRQQAAVSLEDVKTVAQEPEKEQPGHTRYRSNIG